MAKISTDGIIKWIRLQLQSAIDTADAGFAHLGVKSDKHLYFKDEDGTETDLIPSAPYTDEKAQDAIGVMVADTDTVDITYTDSTPELKADVKKQMSITSDSSGLKLSGDSATPGNNKVYGTDSGGTKGWKDDPAGGSVSDVAYGSGWNGDTTTAPSKNAVYDKIETLSGGAGYTFPLDIPPGSPHAKDDEFDGGSLDGKWTNPLTSGSGLDLALSLANSWVIFEPNTSGTSSTGKKGGFGIRQNAPTGSFTIMAKIVNGGHIGDEGRVGIFVARTASNVAHTLGSLRGYTRIANVDDPTYSESAEWGSIAGYDVYATEECGGSVWLKIVWDSGAGSLSFWYSGDGVVWTFLVTRTGQSQPDRIGLVIWANTANIYADHVEACDWFRVTEP